MYSFSFPHSNNTSLTTPIVQLKEIYPQRRKFPDQINAQIPIISTFTTNNNNIEPEINDEIDLMQTLEAEDLTDRMVRFFPLEVWNNSEDNEVEYILPDGYSKI